MRLYYRIRQWATKYAEYAQFTTSHILEMRCAGKDFAKCAIQTVQHMYKLGVPGCPLAAR